MNRMPLCIALALLCAPARAQNAPTAAGDGFISDGTLAAQVAEVGACNDLFRDAGDECVMTVTVPYKEAACAASRDGGVWSLRCSYPRTRVVSSSVQPPPDFHNVMPTVQPPSGVPQASRSTDVRSDLCSDASLCAAKDALGLGSPAPEAQEVWDDPAAIASCTGIPNKNTRVCKNGYGAVLCTGAKQCSDASLFNGTPLPLPVHDSRSEGAPAMLASPGGLCIVEGSEGEDGPLTSCGTGKVLVQQGHFRVRWDERGDVHILVCSSGPCKAAVWNCPDPLGCAYPACRAETGLSTREPLGCDAPPSGKGGAK